ncbi:DNA ligase-associated DEXH box helicase [Luteitalea sp. TBR-22]|uniref:ligase-associated DNA damage response exonuclease n=1 Tax=Luteitalea sp. TBR-22 TaxID=2802971 RepID=UPI001AF4EEBC|nr:ligase-associated DNA damage response exonuclease [Luteitalea sp. TBR-22]BCS31178.1 DNA ligase-associated DEXH box helicase [Luteitalea sp. TBR-22]
MLVSTPAGLHCAAGGFHVDPALPVGTAIVTHAHADHARPGSARYVCAEAGLPILRHRLGPDAVIDAWPYGQPRVVGDVEVSLHPAGHVTGSAQVRVHDGRSTWVVSGDYKRDDDPTCASFEVVACDTFVTEATFALPIYRWPSVNDVLDDLRAWIAATTAEGRPAILFAYSLGKAQRLLSLLAESLDRPALVHGAVAGMTAACKASGVALPDVEPVGEETKGAATRGRLVIAPPSAMNTPWLKRFPGAATAMVSGWMRVRGTRRWKGVDRGFVLSDHADWPALLDTIAATGATRVLATHGYADVLARACVEHGLEAGVLDAHVNGEEA